MQGELLYGLACYTIGWIFAEVATSRNEGYLIASKIPVVKRLLGDQK